MARGGKIDLREVQKRKFLGMLEKYKAFSGIKAKELESLLTMSHGTYYKRINNPWNFTLEEFRLLRHVLGIPKEELMEVLL